jgi:N utilization substance protein A
MLPDEIQEVARLFAEEIAEIAAGTVKIKAIARNRGTRIKLALQRGAPGIDAIQACVGERGCRIQRIVDQLAGERIDLLLWDDCAETLIVNALQPARIQQVILHPAEHRATVLVSKTDLSFVAAAGSDSGGIASGDENRELASRLCGWQISVIVQ